MIIIIITLTYLLTYSGGTGPGWSFAALTSCLHTALSSAICIHASGFTPKMVISSFTLSIHRFLGLPSGLVPMGFPTITSLASLPSSILETCPAHRSRCERIIFVICGTPERVISSWLWRLRHSPSSSSHTGPQILLKMPRSNTLSLLSDSFVRRHVSHPYITIGRIMVV